MTNACIPSPFFSPSFNRFDRGVSDGALALRELKSVMLEDCSQSAIINAKKSLYDLYDLLLQCAESNWDGYGALEVDLYSFNEASRFIQILPTTIPEPEVSVDPDGEMSFEWYLTPRKVFSVSIGARNEITYAGLYGINKSYGREYFGDEIPKAILDNLDRLFS